MAKNVKFFDLRKKANVTQEELAKGLELKQCTISNWENGISKPDVPTIIKISKILNTPIEELAKCFEEV